MDYKYSSLFISKSASTETQLSTITADKLRTDAQLRRQALHGLD